MAEAGRRRCAIYTRKSSEEGLEQDFNSLHAQREACEAYIQSQAGEGWRLVRTHYDDGGYSGGNLDRPALSKLLADIEAGKIDTVVVYKVDRLTRSLADFAKIVEVFDARQVSFVSVTQQFNTTTSMGRLTLNMLLSFAQFEREVTGERIRDKIAASKKRGLWMGGPIPLGYEPDRRTLVIVEEEAETVRTLFRLYLELGTVQRVHEEASRLGLRTKVREGANGHMRGGRPLSRGHIYQLLGNPLYAGRIRHKGKHYEGQHPPIIDLETWEAVQRQLAAQTPPGSVQPRGGRPSPLRGKIFDEAGVALTPSHTVKSGRRYRYYVSNEASSSRASGSGARQKQRWRLPAREVERVVGEAIEALLADPAELVRVAREAPTEAARVPDLLEGVRHWNGAPLALVQRVEVASDRVAISIDLSGFLGGEPALIRAELPAQLRRRGVETKLILTGQARESASPQRDPSLIRAIVRARAWFDDLISGCVGSLAEIAEAEGVSDGYVGHLIPLAFLAPDVVAAVMAGTHPVDLTAEKLVKQMDLPLDWAEQRVILNLAETLLVRHPPQP